MWTFITVLAVICGVAASLASLWLTIPFGVAAFLAGQKANATDTDNLAAWIFLAAVIGVLLTWFGAR